MHMRIFHHAYLTVFVKSKTGNQLIRFVIAYLVADNNVKLETVAAPREPRLHDSSPDLWPPNSPDLCPVDYRICGVLQERIYRKSVKN